MYNRRTVIELVEGSNTVQAIYDNNGKKEERTIFLQDFIDSVMMSLEKDKAKKKNFEPVFSPLYRETNGMKIIQSKQLGRNSFVYILQRDKLAAPMPLNGRFYGNCGMPRLLFALLVVNNRLSKLGVVCVKDELVKEKTKLYQYPFSNLSSFKSAACLGMNRIEINLGDLDNLFKIPDVFFSMDNNMTSYSVKNNAEALEYDGLLDKINNTNFEDDLLVEIKNTSYDTWYKAIFS